MTNGKSDSSKADRDNRSNQLNPNNNAYWQSRGFDERPADEEVTIETKPERPVNKPSR